VLPSILDMQRLFVPISFVTVLAASGVLSSPARAQSPSPLAGIWTLNRSLSEFPREIGFNPSWITAARGDDQRSGTSGGGRGRRGGGGRASGPIPARPESYDEARRVQLLTAEVRNPPVRLMVVDTPSAVTITNELGQSRTLHPDGKEESIQLEGVPIGVTSSREGDRFVVVYRVDRDRAVRYSYSSSNNPSQLVVDVQFLDHGAGDKARRVYEPGVATESLPPTGAATAPAPSGEPLHESFDQRPGAELKGLKSLGILVEDLAAQAQACGLNRDTIESALARRLTAGGFAVRRNSDEDTYVYVNIITTNVSNGTCVSRYDAFLYTHATATLSYRDRPVLVQVSLMHRGGIGASAPTAHAAAVVRGLEQYVDLFVTQINDANK
jgi:hypothetical protein